jgi:hypothetical protein
MLGSNVPIDNVNYSNNQTVPLRSVLAVLDGRNRRGDGVYGEVMWVTFLKNTY